MARQTIDDLVRTARARLDRVGPAEALAEVAEGAVIIDTAARIDG
jgi:hypothetical protein